MDQSVMLGGSGEGGKFQDIKLQANNPFAGEVRKKIMTNNSAVDNSVKRAEEELGKLREQTTQALYKVQNLNNRIM